MKSFNSNCNNTTKSFCLIFLTQLSGTVSSIASLLINLFIVGKYSAIDAISAFEFSLPLIMLYFSLNSCIASGIQSTCTYYAGQNKQSKVRYCFTLSFSFFLICVVLISLILIIFADQVAICLGAENNSVSFFYTKDLIYAYSIGAPGMYLCQILLIVTVINNKKKTAIVSTILILLLNIFFVIVNYFVLNLGIFGLGLAVGISFYLAGFILLFSLLKNDNSIKFDFNRKILNKKYLFLTLRNGLPNAVAQICNTLATWILNLLLMQFGGITYVSASAVMTVFASLLGAPGSCMGTATLLLGNYYYTKKNHRKLIKLIQCFMNFSIGIYVIISVFTFIFSEEVCLLVINSNSEEFNIAVYALRLYSLSLVFYSICVCNRNLIQALQLFKLTQVICVLQNLVLRYVFALIIIALVGVDQIWFMYILGQFATFIIQLAVFYCIRIKRNIKIWDYLH